MRAVTDSPWASTARANGAVRPREGGDPPVESTGAIGIAALKPRQTAGTLFGSACGWWAGSARRPGSGRSSGVPASLTAVPGTWRNAPGFRPMISTLWHRREHWPASQATGTAHTGRWLERTLVPGPPLPCSRRRDCRRIVAPGPTEAGHVAATPAGPDPGAAIPWAASPTLERRTCGRPELKEGTERVRGAPPGM